MLITSSFVLLNVPKSGSSFARTVIKAIYARRRETYRRKVGLLRRAARLVLRSAGVREEDPDLFLKELMLPNIRLLGRAADQHGTFSQIPEKYRDRKIVSVLRNPFEKLVSDYEFRWWARFPPLPPEQLQQHLPNFPDLSFEEYLRMSDLVAAQKLAGENPCGIGNLTVEFFQFFFKKPVSAIMRLGDGFVESGAFKQEIIALTFLHQEQLNEELANFLAEQGFADDEVRLAREFPKINQTINKSEDRAAYWTPWAVQHVLEKERLLLHMLRVLGHAYKPPRPRIA